MKLKKPKKEDVKILVVDDETIVALDIKNTLEKYGYKVVGIAATSQEAIKLVKSSKPNLILMDIMIKGNKDGIETAQLINEFADIPIVFLTAYSDDNTLERAKLVEPYGYLIKPFDNRELFTTIEMSLYKHSMELRIRESEENLAITLNSIGDGVISTDENGKIVKMNPVAESLTGWKYDEAKGLPLEKIFYLIDVNTREVIPNPVEKVIESGNVIGLSNHTLLIAKDGTERNISDSAAPIKDNEGNIRGVVLVFSDVTDAYNARREVKESEEKFRSYIENAPDAIMVVDEKGNCLLLNQAATEQTGYSKDELLKMNVMKLGYPLDSEIAKNHLKDVVEKGEALAEMRYVKKNGEIRYWSIKAIKLSDSRFLGFHRDITEKKLDEIALKESEEKFRQLVSTMEQGLALHEVIYDKNGKVVDYRFLDINDSYTKLTGLKREKVIGKTVKEVLPGVEDYWIEKFGNVAVTGNPCEYENYVHELNRYYHVVAYRNRPNQFAVIVTDITDKKIAEDELRIKEQAIASSINAIALADLNGNLNYVNKSFLELWGFKNENEVLGRSALEFWQNPDDAKKVMDIALEKGSFVGELTAKRKDKKLLSLFLTTTIVYGSDRKPVQIMASFIDVTEKRKAENDLIASEEKLRLLVENAPLGIYHLNFNGEFIYGNKAAEDIIGYKKEELLGRNFLQAGLLPLNEITIGTKLLAKSLAGKPTGPDQMKLIKKDGSEVEVEISTQVMNVGGQKIIMGMVQDITARKKAEENTQLMAELLDISPASVLVHDFDGNILFANKKACEIHGYSEDEFSKLSLLDIDTPESAKLIKERLDVISKEGELVFEVNHKRKDGSSFPLLAITKMTNWNNQNVLLSVSSDITEKKLQEEILRQKTEELDNYFTNALDLFCISTNDGYFLRLNKQWENVLGYSIDEIENKRFMDFIHPDDLEASLNAQSVLNRQEKIIGFTNRFRAKDGSYKFIEWRSYPSGTRIYSAARDITDRKLAEDALRESEERFRSYIENAPDAIMVADDKGNYVLLNKAVSELTGYSKDELLKMNIMELTCPLDFEIAKNHFNDVVEKGEALDEIRYVTKNGEIRYWSLKAVKLSDSRFLGFHRDITERKLDEIALKESEEKFRSLSKSANDAIITIDKSGTIIEWNNGAEKIFGYSENEIKGMNVDLIIPEKYLNDHKNGLARVRNTGVSRILGNTVELHGLKKNGNEFPLELSLAQWSMKGENYFTGIIRDITERKLTESELKLSENKFNRAFLYCTPKIKTQIQ